MPTKFRYSIQILGGIALLLFVASHFLLLVPTYSPWYDDVFFIDISRHLIETGKYTLTAFYTENPQPEIYAYGPVFFQIQALFLQLGGMSYEVARLPTLLAFFGVLYQIYRIGKLLHFTPFTCVAIGILSATDFVLHFAAHQGRMDLVAVYFSLLAFQHLLMYRERKSLLLFATSILFAALMYLTTPRTLVLLVGLPFLLLGENLLRSFYKIAAWGIIWLVLVALGLVLSFGTLTGQIHQLLGSPLIARHIEGGISFIRYPAHLPIYIGVVGSWVWIARKKEMRYLAIALGAMILCFNIVVKEVSPYETLILPYYFLLIGMGITLFPKGKWSERLKNILIYAGIVMGLRTFLRITLGVIILLPQLNISSIDKQIAALVPPNVKVVAEEPYYLALVKQNCQVQCTQVAPFFSHEENQRRAHYHKTVFDYDYLILSHWHIEYYDSFYPNLYLKDTSLVKIGELRTSSDTYLLHTLPASWRAFILDRISTNRPMPIDAVVYKVRRRE